MLKRVERQVLKDENDICVLAKDAKFPSPFESRLGFHVLLEDLGI